MKLYELGWYHFMTTLLRLTHVMHDATLGKSCKARVEA